MVKYNRIGIEEGMRVTFCGSNHLDIIPAVREGSVIALELTFVGGDQNR